MKLKNSHLIAAVVILLCLYILSFIKPAFSARKPFKTALVNPKYKNEITGFCLSKGNDSVFLEKKNDFWYVKNSGQSSYIFPADSELIENLIEELIKVRKLYKISDQVSKNNNFGFEKTSQFYIKCSYKDTFSEFYFGNYDFSQLFRYFMTGKNAKVYQIDSSFEPYLTAAKSFWTEKTIISKKLLNISSSQDIQSIVINGRKITASSSDTSFASYTQSLLELRHGGMLDESIKGEDLSKLFSQSAEAEIFLELGNKKMLSLKVYKSPEENAVENQYVLLVNYENPDIRTVCKISGWTLSKMLDYKIN